MFVPPCALLSVIVRPDPRQLLDLVKRLVRGSAAVFSVALPTCMMSGATPGFGHGGGGFGDV